MKSRIMYIECKAHGLSGPARIGRVTFSKSGQTIHYKNQAFHRTRGYKYNYLDVSTDEEYWISGPRKDGEDRLYGERVPVEIDEDVREEYWLTIRKKPDRVNEKSYF